MATKIKKKTLVKKGTSKLTTEESNLSANMLLLVSFSLFVLIALNFFTKYGG